MDKHSIKVYLKQGSIIIAEYDVDDYDDIYDSWKDGRKFMSFSNCEILTDEVAAIEWDI